MSLGGSGLGSQGDSVKAWCSFDGTSANITATLTGENVDSITDGGTGNYAVNMAQGAVQDIKYTISGSCAITAAAATSFLRVNDTVPRTVLAFTVLTNNFAGTFVDSTNVNCVVVR